jgi:hypothetical protein
MRALRPGTQDDCRPSIHNKRQRAAELFAMSSQVQHSVTRTKGCRPNEATGTPPGCPVRTRVACRREFVIRSLESKPGSFAALRMTNLLESATFHRDSPRVQTRLAWSISRRWKRRAAGRPGRGTGVRTIPRIAGSTFPPIPVRGWVPARIWPAGARNGPAWSSAPAGSPGRR